MRHMNYDYSIGEMGHAADAGHFEKSFLIQRATLIGRIRVPFLIGTVCLAQRLGIEI